MNPQVFYIVFAMMLASTTLSVIFFIAWKTLGEKAYALSWSLGFLGASLQWFTHLQAHAFPSYEWYWITVNAFALVLITLGIRGHCQRTDCQMLPANLWPYAGIIYAGIVWTTLVEPHVGIRTALIPAAASITLILSAWIVIRHREESRAAEWAAATSMILFAASQAAAAGMALMQGAGGDSAYQALYVDFSFLTLPAGYMATGMFVVFMLASDISIDMKEIAVQDQLTGVLNRRGLGEQGAQAYATARRTSRPVSVVMTDIDRFKQINDKYGHAWGDAALVHFADMLKERRRADDILARVGGEEFALILPGTDLKNAIDVADSLCKEVECRTITVEGAALRMTASFGVATMTNHDTCLSDIIVRADRALYRSKRAGRNQVDLESSQLMLAEDGTLKPINA